MTKAGELLSQFESGKYRTVEFDGKLYKVRSSVIEIPDLSTMDRMGALIWLNRNTVPKGKAKPEHPLTGFGGSGIKVN